MSSDERRRGSFPLTKAVLWSRVPQGAALQLKLSAPSVKVSARSIQVLAKEAQLCMSEDKVFRGFVTGDLDFNVAHHCFEFHARVPLHFGQTSTLSTFVPSWLSLQRSVTGISIMRHEIWHWRWSGRQRAFVGSNRACRALIRVIHVCSGGRTLRDLSVEG